MSDIHYFRQGIKLGWIDIQRLVITLLGCGEGRLLSPPYSSTISRYDDGRIATLPKTQNEWRSMEVVEVVETWLREDNLGLSLVQIADKVSSRDREDEVFAPWSIPPYGDWHIADKEGLEIVAKSIYHLDKSDLLSWDRDPEWDTRVFDCGWVVLDVEGNRRGLR